MARLALAFATGAALSHLTGLPAVLAPLLPLLLFLPNGVSTRPVSFLPLMCAVGAGFIAAKGRLDAMACPAPEDGVPVVFEGRFLAPVSEGSVPLASEAGGCAGAVRRVVVSGPVEAGVPVRVQGTWRTGRWGGVLIAGSVERGASRSWSPRWALVRWRGHLLRRLKTLYGSRAPTVAALTLARKEGLDPGLREAFARSGTAHLLAISGFHVGVISSLLLVLLRGAGLPRRRAGTLASGGTWLYVALLGFPDAASRAALILSTLVASRARGRPPARWGGLASALLILLVLDPHRIASPGFQLSFAGAAGLVAWAPALRASVRRWAGRRLPSAVSSVLASGIAATLATLPVVAWHFERVSLVGIPATIVISPLVAFALPGALASLLADALHPGLGRFLAGGVDVALVALEEGTRWVSLPGWTSVWVSRSWVVVVAVAAALGIRLSQRPFIRPRVRRAVGAAFGLTALVLWPVAATVQGRGGVELVAIDVGQGDALALRSPAGRWILVDAGPAVRGDAGGHPVVKALRDRGVVRLEVLIVTHPDLDHIGGVPAVIGAVEVGAVLEPAIPTGKEGYVEALQAAGMRRVPWLRAEAGRRFDVDGMMVEVLHPPPSPHDRPSPRTGQLDANATSVVVAVRFGAFDALLTGDAPAGVEREVAGAIGGGFEVLKVAHHGSDTSTDSVLLARTRPRVGLVSVGRGNRYGHPSPEVLARLRRAGAEVRRTDREGTLRVLARRDGTFRIEAERSGRR